MQRADGLLTSFGTFSGAAIGYLFSGGQIYVGILTAFLWGFITLVIAGAAQHQPQYGPHQ
jgi:hypothetical protein